MPSRIIREGWLESERINELDAPAERFFLRLCLRADDYGRFHANPTLLKSSLFPLREDVRSTDIPRWLAACEKAGLVRCYEVDGKRFVEIGRFDQRTRAKVSKFPSPPPLGGQLPDTCPADGGHPRTEANAESDSETDANIGGGGGAPADAGQSPAAPLIIPLLLNVPEFMQPWGQWQAVRRAGKKPKTSWDEYFAKQLAWLEPFGLQTAIEIVANSARNEWQGLFEPKRGGNGQQPQKRNTSTYEQEKKVHGYTL
jgi:hypothetical protein